MDLIKSFIQIFRYIFFSSKKKILFYYPQHFNRTKEGQNVFFEPLLKVCREENISYLLVEEPDSSTNKPRCPDAIYFDFLFLTIIFFRKLLRLFFRHKTFVERENKLAQIINIITFRKFVVPYYITISNSMINLFASLNDKAKVFDLQHGIIYSTHWGYFTEKGVLKKNLQPDQINFFVYGDGYKDVFYNNPQNIQMLKKRIFVLGLPVDPLKKIDGDFKKQDIILFSLQFTADGIPEIRKEMECLFGEMLTSLEHAGFKILLKHHPRHNNIVDLQSVYNRFSFVSETNEDIAVLSTKVRLHITFSSTTAFDYAAYGIPTFFMFSEKIPEGRTIFYNEFNYPLYKDKSIKDVLSRLKDRPAFADDIQEVLNWYKYFYSDFNKQSFLKVLES